MPEGYVISNIYNLHAMSFIDYKHETNGICITFVESNENPATNIDTENAQLEDILIHGNRALLVIKE